VLLLLGLPGTLDAAEPPVAGPSGGSHLEGPDSTAVDSIGASGQGASEALQDAPPFTMRIGARLQLRHRYETEGQTHLTRVQRGRLSFSGQAYEDFEYLIQLELAGPGVRLFDASVRYQLHPGAVLWAGQGKAPFGRQQLTSSGALHFVDRSIVDVRFAPGRQQGVAVGGMLAGERLQYQAGVFNGDGINQTQNPGGRMMSVGRLVFTPLGAFPPEESAHVGDSSPRVALGVAGLTNREVVDGIGVDVSRVGSEAAFRTGGLNMTAEFFREWAEPTDGERMVTDGGHGQIGYLWDFRHEVVARYALIRPELQRNSVETGIAYSYYVAGHRAKLQADIRNLRSGVTGEDEMEFRVQFTLAL
jgi:phosphate-selective porin OprO and OprP